MELNCRISAFAGHPAEYKLQIKYRDHPVELGDGETVVLRRPSYQAVSLGYGPLHPDRDVIAPDSTADDWSGIA